MTFLILFACPIVINFITNITIGLGKYVNGNFSVISALKQISFAIYVIFFCNFFQLIATMVLIFLVEIVGSICISQSFA